MLYKCISLSLSTTSRHGVHRRRVCQGESVRERRRQRRLSVRRQRLLGGVERLRGRSVRLVDNDGAAERERCIDDRDVAWLGFGNGVAGIALIEL